MRALLLSAALLLSSCALEPFPLPLVVKVENGSAVGSGTPITSEWVLTVAHLEESTTVNGLEIREKVKHPVLDLMLVRVDPQEWPTSRLSRVDPKLGDHLRTIGYQWGLGLRVVGGYQGEDEGDMSCAIISGASGGPVVNDMNEVVGVSEELYIMYSPPMNTPIPIYHVSRYVNVVELRSWILSTIHP